LKRFLNKTLGYAWEGFVKNWVTILVSFLLSGGYLFAINALRGLRARVRSIPTDYVLTPLVLLVIVTIALWRINRKQRHQLKTIQEPATLGDHATRFVTHYGVWWKIYPDSDYLEDFPYCPCCQPPRKLVQTEWYPDEAFRCPQTSTEVKLYDGVPQKLAEVRARLYETYFGPSRLHEPFFKELRRLRELHPDRPNGELLKSILGSAPFDLLPDKDRESLLSRFSKPEDAISFMQRNRDHYLQLIRRKDK